MGSFGNISTSAPSGVLHKIEVIVDYNNGDIIRASFLNEEGVSDFLKRLEN